VDSPQTSPQTSHRAGYWANAGVLRLERIGADQATAAPAPTRFSIRRRDSLSVGHPSFLPLSMTTPFQDAKKLPVRISDRRKG
jgi:hypothetical protein